MPATMLSSTRCPAASRVQRTAKHIPKAQRVSQNKGWEFRQPNRVVMKASTVSANGAAVAEAPTAADTTPPPSLDYNSTSDPRLSAATVKHILGLFDTWNGALASGNPEKVADLYAPDGVLLPTVSNSVRADRDGLVDYFTAFLKLKPQGVIDEYGIRQEAADADGEPCVVSNSGIYTFTFGTDGRQVQARYTYVYKKIGADWKILSHHSSQLPSQLVPSAFTGKKYSTPSTTDELLTKSEEKGVLDAFYKWNSALKTLDPEQVVDLYAPDAILLPTVADDVRTTKQARREYFIDFLKNQPQGELDEHHIRLIGRDSLGLPNAVSNQGIYTFNLKAAGKTVQARYTFNYVREGDRWLIKKHHSSAMPESTKPEGMEKPAEEQEAPQEPSTDALYHSTSDPRLSATQVQEILGMFETWNAALATGKPEKVADLYAEDGVLLPTVSNSVRVDRDGLLDYFTNFLKLQPQGVIDEFGIRQEATDADGEASVISNSGIYTFTMGATGAKVQARYTYVYKKVDGAWKILSHHSSQLPSQLLPSAYTGKKYINDSSLDAGLTKSEATGVLNAFMKWNNALKTLNPEAVIDLYAPDAILLPTVADDVRTTKQARREYFIEFLKNRPQGRLDEYHIRLIGRDSLGLPNAVSNQGIYTFELKASGKMVQARYTFNYVREGDRWLIKKHHSSAMPESTSK